MGILIFIAFSLAPVADSVKQVELCDTSRFVYNGAPVEIVHCDTLTVAYHTGDGHPDLTPLAPGVYATLTWTIDDPVRTKRTLTLFNYHEVSDINKDGSVNIADVVELVNRIFK